MKRIIHILGAVLLLAVPATAANAYEGLDQGFRAAEPGLNEEEMAGAELWYKATAGTSRFTTYVFQQRMGVLIDWYRVLRADQHGERFKIWGLINDPGCCVPGSAGCQAKSMEETFGFEYCPGDDQLLKYVGKTGYRDPGCDFKDPGGLGDKQDPCDLEFGTSTGALGFRKFPNPRFDPERWRKVNGGKLGTWDGYRERKPAAPGSTMMVSHLADSSIEPPFLIGMSCGACHIAFNPVKPPKDTANPEWENLKLLVGNQYIRSSEIMASGMPTDSPEWQLFSHERPGTVDTSAIPNDVVHNPGTMNAVISFTARPTFANEKVMKWRRVQGCAAGVDETSCWCEPGKPGKCWERSLKEEAVHHILKGGEDSIGINEAIQRVYFNIGSCSEECWLNHLTDLRQLDPTQRNFGQTPFDIGQCRRDCAGFRAIEDRLDNLKDFFLANGPADLYQARGLEDLGDLVEQLDAEFGKGSVTRGKTVFAANCARCHSTQNEPFDQRDFTELKDNRRIDFLGTDKATLASEVGTYRCRALHSNHMKGHIWEEYASETHRERPGDPGIPDQSGGGRGYYRNISLVNVWAHAPFLHNNAIGPEICGKPADPNTDLYRSPYVQPASFQRVEPAPDCWAYDPSVDGRYKLFKASVDELLNPDKRGRKVSLLDENIRIDFGPNTLGDRDIKIKNLKLVIPEGVPAGLLVSFQHKLFVEDLVLAKTNRKLLESNLAKRLGSEEEAKEKAAMLDRLAGQLLRNLSSGQAFTVAAKEAGPLLDLYASCTADTENDGHRFGESLSAEDKKALTAFLATL
ncbi:MAG TPA: cytochrome c [Thermoanaerobaculia bacterium]|nr:cytochrome c [Thermoanaerobaculia bacterium]